MGCDWGFHHVGESVEQFQNWDEDGFRDHSWRGFPKLQTLTPTQMKRKIGRQIDENGTLSFDESTLFQIL